MCQEYSIGNNYIVIMQQTIQTAELQIINRIEIGRVIGETKSYLLLQTDKTKRYVKKDLIVKLIDISNNSDIVLQLFIDTIEEVLI